MKSSKRQDLNLAKHLLLYVAAAPGSDPAEAVVSRLAAGRNDVQFHQLLAAGMGPLLHFVLGDRTEDLPAGWRDALLSADLTAQVRHAAQLETALDVVDVCIELGIRPTLLKGISISGQHYPAPHLRPKGDIDILVSRDVREAVEAALVARGYRQQSDYPVDENSKHGAPICHPKSGIWIEVHSSLFHRNTPLGNAGVFARDDLRAQSLESDLHGRSVFRFTNEMQLVYLASFWVQDVASNGFHPSFLVSLFDAIYLLGASTGQIDWDALPGWVENERALASLYLMLSFLARQGIWSPSERSWMSLAAGQRIIGPLEVRVVHAMLDRYILQGKPFTRLFHSKRVWQPLLTPGRGTFKLLRLPWDIVFPPTELDRFSLGYQMQRVPRLLSRLGLSKEAPPDD